MKRSYSENECHKGSSAGKEVNIGANLRFTLTVLTIINLLWLVVFINVSFFHPIFEMGPQYYS